MPGFSKTFRLFFIVGITFASTDWALSNAEAAIVTNLLTNGGFEDSTLENSVGWTPFGTNRFFELGDGSGPQEGIIAAKFFQNFGGGNNFAGVFQDVLVTGGESYEFSGFLRNGNGSTDYLDPGNSAFLKIEWYSSDSTFDSTTLLQIDENNTLGQGINADTAEDNAWIRNSFIRDAPIDAVTARAVAIHAYIGSGTTGGSSWFDNTQFGVVAVPEPSSGMLLLLGVVATGLTRRSRDKTPSQKS